MARKKGIRTYIKQADWDGLEEDFCLRATVSASEAVAHQISRVPLVQYVKRMRSLIKRAYHKAARSSCQAIYFEFDMDNEWYSTIFVCQDYNPERKKDDEWACDYCDEMVAPTLPKFGVIYSNHVCGQDGEGATDAVESLLIASTVAAIGRAASGLDLKGVALCVGYHGQDIVFRIRELLPCERKRKKPKHYDFYQLYIKPPPGCHTVDPPGNMSYCDGYRKKGYIRKWPMPTYRTDGSFADLLGGSDGALLCSKHLRKVLDENKGDRDVIQWLEAKIKTSTRNIRKYYVLHFPKAVDVIDYEESRIFKDDFYIANPYIHQKAAGGHKVFVIKYRKPTWGIRLVVISNKLRMTLNALKITGIEFKGLESAG